MSDIIAESLKRIIDRHGELEEGIDSLPEVAAHFLLVHAAQGAMDNGGYLFFFGSDWPGNPSYQQFADAYRVIGCETQASDFERVFRTFPFENPHLKKDERREYMEKNLNEEGLEVAGWGDALCDDKEVWEKLAAYCEVNKTALG